MIRMGFFAGILLVLAALPGATWAQQGTEKLRADFENPPADTRPGCYWYWINDNISTAGITKDLEAMARVGIGRAYIGHIFEQTGKADTPVGDVKFMSPAWWEALQWAVKEAGRCGVEIGFFNAPGWSQSGAPWIKPSESMRYLGHSETPVAGGKSVDVVLPVPEIDTFPNAGGSVPTRHGPNFTEADFQDVRVVAFRQPDGIDGPVEATVTDFSGGLPNGATLADGDLNTTFGLPVNDETTITFRLAADGSSTSPIQTALITAQEQSYTLVVTAEQSDDGKSFRPLTTYTEARGHQGPKRDDVVAVPLGPVSGQYVRLGLKYMGGSPPRKFAVAEIALSREPMLAGYARKQLGETSPDIIIPPNAYTWDTQTSATPGSAVASTDVLDLTDRMTSGGRLQWEAPAGNWKVLRMGMIPIGTQCAPCSPESRGLEIDKMNRQHAATIFEGMVGEFIKRTPEADRKALKYVIADSYETGPQNWTDSMVEKFEQRFGYSPVKFLPVMTGRVVDSPEMSDRFLWDLRRLVVESVAKDYVGGLREIANRSGLSLWLENYGHWGFLSEFLLYGSQADEIGGEFWESSDPIGSVECRAAASAAHIYGKTSVFAEGFTSSRTFKQSPASLKPWLDWAFGSGINHLILHVYIHQPTEKKPGIIAWFGTAFNRHNTWFDQAKPFFDYMRRSAVLLKHGQPVADVAYYIGEDAPNMQGAFEPELPAGYDFDHINSDVLVNNTTVKDGRIVLPHGVSYSVLVLPQRKAMRPEVAEAVAQLVRDGAVVIGPKPERTPSLEGYPESDAKLKKIAEDLWGRGAGEARQYGNGWIYPDASLGEVLKKQEIGPDVEIVTSPTMTVAVAGTRKLGVNQTGGILFKHRADDNLDIYFISNTSPSTADIKASFRQSGRRAFLWNAVTGAVEEAKAFEFENNRTVLPLRLAAGESIFVLFGEGNPVAGHRGSAASNAPDYETVATLAGPWKVQFDDNGVQREETFDSLIDWSKHPDKKVKYYSGSATYRNTFKLSAKPVEPTVLQLGEVGILATVSVNGKEAGTVWTSPWSVDISKLVREGENDLEITVTNTWNNRLVGDAEGKLDPPAAFVSRAYDYNKKNPLLPAGLTGPVTVQVERRR